MSIEVSLDELEKEIVACRKCPRLVDWRETVGRVKRRAFRDELYWAKPVPGFGDSYAEVLILGLAPGAHGSNRTGRMFTGDASGDFLYPALFRAGFANQPSGKTVGDGLKLDRIYISALCRCAPPDNKPEPEEMINCREYLMREISLLKQIKGIVALGKLAYDVAAGISRPWVNKKTLPEFRHGAFITSEDGSLWVLGSYHPSRQNTQTGRLTAEMFDSIWQQVNQLLIG
jgi:uracil-DNA glycosylase family 4